MKNPHWFTIQNIHEIDSPALVVYPDRVKENIRLITSMIDASRLRPHIKTHKTREVSLMLIEAGVTKFKCATIAEAELLGICSAPDVLLAYQPVGPKLQRFISLIKNFPATQFSCLIDHPSSAAQIAEAAAKENLTISVFIDINAGMNRTGIKPGKEAIDLYGYAAQLSSVEPKGFHVYDGHIRHTDLRKRKEESDAAFATVDDMRKQLVSQGYDEPVIIGGGTPTFPIHAMRQDVECSPGTFVYWDAGYLQQYSEQPFLPAALIITRVVSLPQTNMLCLDLGHKSIAAENDLQNRFVFLNANNLKPVSQSEEHLVVEVTGHHSYTIGDVFYALPVHICPSCALYEKAYVVEDGTVKNEWKIAARDRTITY